MKTNQEIQEFLNTNNLQLEELDSNQSYKTSIFLINQSFVRIINYLENTLSFIKNLYETINIQNITNLVLDNLSKSKNSLDINISLLDGQTITQDIGNKRFRLTRTENYKVTIIAENFTDWITDSLLIQVKTSEGMLVYPTIITIDNKIDIYFNDMIGSNYKIYWI